MAFSVFILSISDQPLSSHSLRRSPCSQTLLFLIFDNQLPGPNHHTSHDLDLLLQPFLFRFQLCFQPHFVSLSLPLSPPLRSALTTSAAASISVTPFASSPSLRWPTISFPFTCLCNSGHRTKEAPHTVRRQNRLRWREQIREGKIWNLKKTQLLLILLVFVFAFVLQPPPWAHSPARRRRGGKKKIRELKGPRRQIWDLKRGFDFVFCLLFGFVCIFRCFCRSPEGHLRRERKERRRSVPPVLQLLRRRRVASDGGAWEDAPPVHQGHCTASATVPALFLKFFLYFIFIFMCLFEFLLYFLSIVEKCNVCVSCICKM